MIDVLDLQPEVVAALKEAGVCKFLMKILIDTDKAKCQTDVKVVRDAKIPDGLNSFLTTSQQQLFDRAVSAGLMNRLPDGRYHWRESKALLAYFCGRVFCGDYSQDGVWQCGKGRFPKNEVERLFGEDWIGSYRRKRVLLHVPRNYAVVERLVERI